MAQFVYTAVEPNGRTRQGVIDASHEREAYSKLKQQGLAPSKIETAEATQETATSSRLKSNEIILFSEELSQLLDAGLQIEAALRVIATQQQSKRLRDVASSIRTALRDGSTLAKAMRTANFDEMYCNLVSAGERSGALSKILRKQCDYLNAMSDLKNKLIQSLIYPCFVLIAGLALIGVFTILVIPQLNLMFQKTGASIPWMTRMLMDVANLLKKDIGLILGAMIAVAIGLKIWTQRASGKRWWHQLQLQAPLIGQALSCQLYAQFSYALSNLIANGIPALNAMALLERSFPNIWVRENIQSLIKQVAEGRSLSEGLKRIKGFPPILADYLIVGEQTGDLASALQHAAARLEKEMNRNIQLLVQLIQPIVILFVGLLVGVLVISMMTGIFQTVSTLRLH